MGQFAGGRGAYGYERVALLSWGGGQNDRIFLLHALAGTVPRPTRQITRNGLLVSFVGDILGAGMGAFLSRGSALVGHVPSLRSPAPSARGLIKSVVALHDGISVDVMTYP
jgi:hypothetical protein